MPVNSGRQPESLELKILKSLRFTKAEWAVFSSQMLSMTEDDLERMAIDESLAIHRRYLAAVILKGFRAQDDRILDKVLDRIIGKPDQEITTTQNSTDNLRMLPSAALRERVALIYNALNSRGESDEP
jgi:hypothetical protein